MASGRKCWRIAVLSVRRAKLAPPLPNAANLKLGIVVSDYHASLAEALLAGARGCLRAHGVPPDAVTEVSVPGAFEIPQAVSWLLAASHPAPDAILALGVLIRGDTFHFEVLSREVCRSLEAIGCSTGVPVAFGVLTVDTEQQARDRAGEGRTNKGWEAAEAAVRMALLFRQIRKPRGRAGPLPHRAGRRRVGK